MPDPPLFVLSDQQRRELESVLLRHFRAKYPGRPVTVEWDEPDALANVPASRRNDDRGEHAA